MPVAIPAMVIRSRDKTAKCAFLVQKVHPFIGKLQRPKRFITAHDARNVTRMGDTVVVMPAERHHALSRTKRWVVAGVLSRAARPAATAMPWWPKRWLRREALPFRLPLPRDNPKMEREVRF